MFSYSNLKTGCNVLVIFFFKLTKIWTQVWTWQLSKVYGSKGDERENSVTGKSECLDFQWWAGKGLFGKKPCLVAFAGFPCHHRGMASRVRGTQLLGDAHNWPWGSQPKQSIVWWRKKHNIHVSDTKKQIPGDSEGQGSLACCSPRGCKESDMTEQLNKWNSKRWKWTSQLRQGKLASGQLFEEVALSSYWVTEVVWLREEWVMMKCVCVCVCVCVGGGKWN